MPLRVRQPALPNLTTSYAALLPEKRWQRQPPLPQRIDWSNPLTRGLGRLVTPSYGLLDVAANNIASAVNSVVRNPLGFSGTVGSASAIVLSDFATTRYTCLFVAVTYSAGSLEPRMVTRSDGAATYNQNYALNLNNGITPRAGHKQVSNNAYPYVQSSISVPAGGICVGVSTYDGSNIKVFTNGRLGGSVAASDPYTSLGASGATQFLNSDGTSRFADAAYRGPGFLLGAIWNRALTDDEVADISANPWQIFQPLRGIPVTFDQPTTSYAALLPEKQWEKQPPYRTDIDWSNPLAKRLRLAQTSSGGLVDLVNQWPATKAASDEIRGVNIPRLGPAVSFKGARATDGGINFGQVQAVKTDTITVLILANPNTTQAQTVFSQRAGSSPFNQFSFGVNSNGALTLDSGRIAAVCLPVSGSARNSISVGNTFTNGGWHVYVTTFAGDPAYPIIYYDGASVAVTNSLSGTGTWVSSAQHTRIGNVADYTTDANYAASCDIPLCLVWDRVLSADEVRQISANPWQLFQPIRGIPVSFEAGGASAQTLTPSLYTNNQTFYSPTVTPGAVTLSPSLYTNQQTFYSPTVTAGALTLAPNLYTNNQTFYSPTVTAGALTLTPSLYTNNQTFYAPTVTAGAVTLTPSLYTNNQTFYAPTVTAGAITLTPSLYTNNQTFYAPTVAIVTLVTVTGVLGTGSVGSASVTGGAQVFPTGVVGTGQVGSVEAGEGTAVVVTGVLGTGQVGLVVTQAGAGVFPAGVFGTGQVGSVGFRFSTDVAVVGVMAQGLVTPVLIWGPIDDSQTPNWQNVDDSQPSNWTVVNDSNTVTWTSVVT